MTPDAFIRKWSKATLKERSAAQEHFIDLCRLLGEKTPAEADPEGTRYTFEAGATKTGGGSGWADVWKRGCFAWEYKGKHKDLNAALKQLQQYALALENPPLLIVSDLDTFVIHTNFTNTVHEVHTLPLADLADPGKRRLLKWAFTEPERLRPGQTAEAVTAKAAGVFAELAHQLRKRGHDPQRVAHFINKLLFCMFAEDIGVLKTNLFTELLATAIEVPTEFEGMAGDLFAAMQSGGRFGYTRIPWFNGGLFADAEVIPLEAEEIRIAHKAALLDWSNIEPAIFGTLFERGLDPGKRSQLGAHYTDRGSILRIIEPVIERPLLAEWETVKETIRTQLEKADKAKSASASTKARHQAEAAFHEFLERLRTFRVLDPACGSGNFLYVALQTLKDLEHRAMLEAEALGLQRGFPSVGPEAVLGIEINPYAAELARVTVWIGEIQWMLQHGYNLNINPVLRPLDQVACRDALLNEDGTEAEWPEAEVIVGNPPFLGSSKLLSTLGDDYAQVLRRSYQGRVPGGADFVAYWFEKARLKIEQRPSVRAGLVATQAIRKGSSRQVLDNICSTCMIFDAWKDEPWVNEGAAVRVSLICFSGKDAALSPMLDGDPVSKIYADLTGQAVDDRGEINLTLVRALPTNQDVAIKGSEKGGPFDIPGDLARKWLKLPMNPNGRTNNDVLRPWVNGMDITGRSSDKWIIDFGVGTSETEAALYEAPFEYARTQIKPVRLGNREMRTGEKWWLHRRSGEQLRNALKGLSRFIATPRVAKHRLFVWLNQTVLPDSRLYAIAREDDTIFGILHSRFHEIWSLATCSWHGVGNDPTYNVHSCFETFPFPEGLIPNIPATDYADAPHAQAITEAARRLIELRDNWLNPPEWVKRVPEVVPGYPDRLIPVDENAAKELKKRTLTNLYNQRPTWLANAHNALDEAVAAAYGWPADLSDDEVLRRLLALNLERIEIKRNTEICR